MQQRQLRPGDILDDYCPRERRLTNHVVVAMIGEDIKQTRCTTCDAEHVYKDAKVPRRRKKDEPEALYDEVLTDLTGGQLVGKTEPRPAESAPAHASASASAPTANDTNTPEPPAAADEPVDDRSGDDHWPAHRTLIRATLPKVEGGEPPPRPIPEFTMHQRQGRGGQGFRYGQGWPNGNGNSNGNSAGHGRNGFRGGGRHGGQGHGQGHPGGGGGHHRHRGGKHRQPK